ncbi:TIGR03085 family protein, partial [Micromonospora chalcea]
MPRYARTEREALADLMLELGPDAPTVNEGWTTRDLAAHLLVRERRPDAAGGILLPPLRGYGESVRRRIAAGPYA